MTTQTIDPNQIDQKARQIRVQVSTVLTKWGLLPRFKRWRLTQDPDTGMIVLFGILNHKYIATHTSIPFSNYFDTHVLHDLANELEVQVVSCNSDGLRYAFILDRGQFGKLPTHIDFPYIDNGEVLARVVYGDNSPPLPIPQTKSSNSDDHKLVDEGVQAFLKVFDDLQVKDAAVEISRQNVPNVVIINGDEFYKRVAEHEANRLRRRHIKKLFGEATEEKHQ